MTRYTKNETKDQKNKEVNINKEQQEELETVETKQFNAMDYINIRKDDMFASVTLKTDAPSEFSYEDSIAITLRMLYENQKKILNNQKQIWLSINNASPDDILKYDLQRSMRKIANGFLEAADGMYR